MEVMMAVQSGMLLCALRVQLKRRVSARSAGDYNEVPGAIQNKSRPSPSNCVTPFACKLLSEQVFGFRKANIVECRVFASHFPSDEVQNEAEVGQRIQFVFGSHSTVVSLQLAIVQGSRGPG